LNLFGSGNKGGDAKGAGAGMMDQLAMFKKAQEMASKKKEMDAELAMMSFEGIGADGKVKAAFKYVPNTNPMDPNPDYDAQSFEFDDDFFESSSPEDIAAAVKEAILNGIETTNTAVAEKYAVLQKDLMEAFGGGK
jgi:DNA-binding protein YbaB